MKLPGEMESLQGPAVAAARDTKGPSANALCSETLLEFPAERENLIRESGLF
jgi:hypothetical protein